MKNLTLDMIPDQVGTVHKVYSHKTSQYVDERVHDVFGNLISQTGTNKTNVGFQGKCFDQESGLNYFYQRYYSPTIGRFINEDPIGLSGGLNMYGFVENNPANWTDRFGLQKRISLLESTPVGSIPTGGCNYIYVYFIEKVKYDIHGNREVIDKIVSAHPFIYQPTECFLGCFLGCMYMQTLYGTSGQISTKQLIIEGATSSWRKVRIAAKFLLKWVKFISPYLSIILTLDDIRSCYNKCKHLL